MKLQIRQGTFETNSSSTHSFVVNKGKVKERKSIEFSNDLNGCSSFYNYLYAYLLQEIYVGDSLTAMVLIEKIKTILNENNVEFSMKEYDSFIATIGEETSYYHESYEEDGDLTLELVGKMLKNEGYFLFLLYNIECVISDRDYEEHLEYFIGKHCGFDSWEISDESCLLENKGSKL